MMDEKEEELRGLDYIPTRRKISLYVRGRDMPLFDYLKRKGYNLSKFVARACWNLLDELEPLNEMENPK